MNWTQAKRNVRFFLKENPFLYGLARKLKYGRGDDKLCRSGHDLCVEGYPCSANSFVYVLLMHLNKELSMGHHTHSVANIKIALKHGLPAVVLIRNPEDAISSRLVRFNRDVDECILEYIRFYTYVARCSDELLILPFDEVTEETGKSIRRIVETTGIELSYDDLRAVKKRVFEYIREWTNKYGDERTMSLPVTERAPDKLAQKNRLIHSRYFKTAEALHRDVLRRLSLPRDKKS